jgi:hypothetical protein
MFKTYNCIEKSSTPCGQITLNELIEIIKGDHQLSQKTEIELYRELYTTENSKSSQFNEIKKTILCFTPNSVSENSFRNSKKLNSTGYIYFDFDFKSKTEAIEFKEKVKSINSVELAYISISGLGLGLLVKVNKDNVNLVNFKGYWNYINDTFFQSKADKKTCDFKRLNILSYDNNIYHNPDAIELESIIEGSSIKYSTDLPFELFDHSKPYTFIPEGYNYVEIKLNQYKKNKIKEGFRNSTLGAICLQLIYLNPDADYLAIYNVLNYINNNYCSTPMKNYEVSNIVKSNFKKKDEILNNVNGIMDKYIKVKKVFFNGNIPRIEKLKIINMLKKNYNIDKVNKSLEKYFNQKRDISFQEIEYSSINNIQSNGKRDIIDYIVNDTKLKKSTIYNILNQKRDISFQEIEYSSINNIQSNGKRDIHIKINEAIENLQDGINKITQEKVAKYLNLNIKTIKRNWINDFKLVVKDYNKSIKGEKRDISFQEIEYSSINNIQSNGKRDIIDNEDIIESKPYSADTENKVDNTAENSVNIPQRNNEDTANNIENINPYLKKIIFFDKKEEIGFTDLFIKFEKEFIKEHNRIIELNEINQLLDIYRK